MAKRIGKSWWVTDPNSFYTHIQSYHCNKRDVICEEMKNIHCLGALKMHTVYQPKWSNGNAEAGTFNTPSGFSAEESQSFCYFLQDSTGTTGDQSGTWKSRGFPKSDTFLSQLINVSPKGRGRDKGQAQYSDLSSRERTGRDSSTPEWSPVQGH